MSIPRDVISPQPRPPEKSNTCLILGLVFGGFGGFLVLCLGCCGFGMWFSFGEIERQTRADLANNPVIQEHVGTVNSFKMDWMASINKSNDGEEDTFVFSISGEKGSGTIVADVLNADDGSLYVDSGQLTMDSGEVYELIGGEEPSGEPEVAPEAPADANLNPVQNNASSAEESLKFTRKVQAALSGNPVLAEQIGDIAGFTYDLDMSAKEPGEDVYVFHLVGSKAIGTLRAECITLPDDTEQVSSAELTLDTGEEIQLFPDKPLE